MYGFYKNKDENIFIEYMSVTFFREGARHIFNSEKYPYAMLTATYMQFISKQN